MKDVFHKGGVCMTEQHGGYSDYPFVAEFYDFIEPYRTRDDIPFYLELAQAVPGRMLEVGCGTGRVLLPVARAGKEITGLDLSEFMLNVCRDKLSRESVDVQRRVKLVQSDMRRFHLRHTYSLVTIPFRSFQHLLTVEDQLECLTTIARHLEPSGLLILDLFNPSLPHLVAEKYLEEYGDEPEFALPDGRVVTRRQRIVSRDWLNHINDVELIYYVKHPDGRSERLVHAFRMRYLFRFEAEHLLARCGLRVEDVYADFQKTPYGSKYPGELILVGRKEN
jgi:ubiquinone/menaquinone biosynthesis C-methylase UbiE